MRDLLDEEVDWLNQYEQTLLSLEEFVGLRRGCPYTPPSSEEAIKLIEHIIDKDSYELMRRLSFTSLAQLKEALQKNESAFILKEMVRSTRSEFKKKDPFVQPLKADRKVIPTHELQ